MLYDVTVMPRKQKIEAAAGENLLKVLRAAGFFVNAVCGGNGSCGKCKVWIDGQETRACRTIIDRDMTVVLSPEEALHILTDSIKITTGFSSKEVFYLAFDIGTTTVVGYLLDGESGQALACESTLNPQAACGADVISRIQYAINGHIEELTAAIRKCITDLAHCLCEKAGLQPQQVRKVSIVGNPAMQQFFLYKLQRSIGHTVPELKTRTKVNYLVYLAFHHLQIIMK